MHVSHLDDAPAFVLLDGSTIRDLAGPVSLPTEKHSPSEPSVPAGGATAERHHVLSDELNFFTAGSGYLRGGDEYREVRTGHCVVISPGVIPKVTYIADDPLELPCCFAPPYSDDDTIRTGG